MNRQIGRGKIKMYNRHEMMDIVVIEGKARGIITRNLVNGKIERHGAHAVVIASGGYGNVFFLSTNAMGSNVSAGWKIHKKGAYFANPCFTLPSSATRLSSADTENCLSHPEPERVATFHNLLVHGPAPRCLLVRGPLRRLLVPDQSCAACWSVELAGPRTSKRRGAGPWTSAAPLLKYLT